MGERFGTRVVVEEMPLRKNGYVMYKVRCDCGEEIVLNGSYLKQKNRPCKSCSAKLHTRKGEDHYFFKHGMSTRTKGKDRIYSIWVSMRQRCNDPNDLNYHNYGGRGIKVCPEWDDFLVFYNDMGERPEGSQLDRIDNEGNYCKQNCRWAPLIVQANNRRNNRHHLINGEKVCHTDLLKKIGFSRDKFRWLEERKGLQWIYDNFL